MGYHPQYIGTLAKNSPALANGARIDVGGGRLGVDHRMDQPDFVARHRERPALGQRLKEKIVVGATSGQPAGDQRAALHRPDDDNVAGLSLFRSIDDQVVAVDPQRVNGRTGPSPVLRCSLVCSYGLAVEGQFQR